MYIKVINPKKHGKAEYDNAGSCTVLVNYLSKEDKDKGLEKEFYFSHDQDKVTSIEVIRSIDGNSPDIEKHEAKFYSLVVAPKPEEMEHLKHDKAELKAYVRDSMDIYAGNFNKKNGTSKNLTGEDLVYFAKLEENRYYKGTDEEVKQGKAKQGEPLPGDNTHIHIIVSRKDKTKKIKLSPLANSKKLFHREELKLKCCDHFDKKYNYVGSGKEIKRHIVMRDGTIEEKIAYVEKEYEQTRFLRDKQNEFKKEQEVSKSVKQEENQKQDKSNNFGIGF